jgi:hypothetical protein
MKWDAPGPVGYAFRGTKMNGEETGKYKREMTNKGQEEWKISFQL